MVTITHKLQPDDFSKAAFLHLRPRPALAVLLTLMLVFCVVALIMSLATMEEPDWTIYAMLFVFVYLVLRFLVILPYRAKKQFSQNRFAKREAECRFDEEGLHTKSEIDTSDIPWDNFHAWKESKRLVLLYITDRNYLVFPRRLFDEPGWEEFRELLGQNVKKRG